MLIAIANHNQNANAIRLRHAFAAHAVTRLIDSGSRVGGEEAPWFDDRLENVYYSGIVNRAFERAAELGDADAILFITSDVRIDDPAHLLARLTLAFGDSKVEVWAPVSTGSGHPQMWPRPGARLRRVSFVEGFCFAARKRILARLCPIDLSVNRLGWGLDVQLGFLAGGNGGCCVVDDGVEVFHPQSTGYDTEEAKQQRSAWYASLPPAARFYRRFATWPGFREGPGCGLLRQFARFQNAV